MRFTDIFGYDDGLLYNLKSGKIYCNLDREGYIRVRISGKEYRAHRIIWEMFKGAIEEGMLIDHIDGDVYNNRIENLRVVSRQQNNANRKVHANTTGLPRGVTINTSGKYRARTTCKGITYSLGTFNTPEEAHLAVVAKHKEINTEYSAFNIQ